MMYTANDNGSSMMSASQSTLGNGDSVGHHLEARDRAEAYEAGSISQNQQDNRTPRSQKRTEKRAKKRAEKHGGKRGDGNGTYDGDGPSGVELHTGSHIGFILTFCIWLGAIAAAFVYLQEYAEPLIRILIFVGVGWAALLLAYVCAKQKRHFFRDLALSGLLASIGGAAFVIMNNYNISVNPAFLIGSAALVTALLAAILRERYFLTVSSMAALSWTAMSLTTLQISPLYWVFPTVWIIQMVLAVEMRAKLPLILATISGMFWVLMQLFILTTHAQISALMAVCTLFALGITYSRVGKSMQERQVLSGLFQTNLGWVIAAVSALLLQDYWMMDTPHMPWGHVDAPAVTSYPLMAQWGIFILLCLGILGLYSLFRLRVRYNSFRDTFIGGSFWSGLALVGFAALLPASIVFHTQFINIMQQFGFTAIPNVGLIIRGGITALSLGMLASGYQRGKMSMVILAIITLCAEAILVMERLYLDPNNMFVFGFAVLLIAITTWLYTRNANAPLIEATPTPQVANV